MICAFNIISIYAAWLYSPYYTEYPGNTVKFSASCFVTTQEIIIIKKKVIPNFFSMRRVNTEAFVKQKQSMVSYVMLEIKPIVCSGLSGE